LLALQFPEGCSTRSIANISTNPFVVSSLKPSLSCSAVKIAGFESSGAAGDFKPGAIIPGVLEHQDNDMMRSYEIIRAGAG